MAIPYLLPSGTRGRMDKKRKSKLFFLNVFLMDLLPNGHDFQIHITKFKIQEFIKKKKKTDSYTFDGTARAI